MALTDCLGASVGQRCGHVHELAYARGRPEDKGQRVRQAGDGEGGSWRVYRVIAPELMPRDGVVGACGCDEVG